MAPAIKRLLGAVTLTLHLAVPVYVGATPVAVEYDVILDGFVTDGAAFDAEGHVGTVTFDTLPELVPNDLNPGPPPPFLDGHDLIVTEGIVYNSDGSETITIWVEGQSPLGPFPTPGASLFANPLDSFESVFFDVFGLHWGELEAAISDIEVLLAFSGGEVLATNPLFAEVTGLGTELDPLGLSFDLDPVDFEAYGPATGLHLSFDARHVEAPEPALVLLLGLGFALLMTASWARARSAVGKASRRSETAKPSLVDYSPSS